LEGTLIPTPDEAAKNEILKANQAIAIAEQETQRAEREAQRAEHEKSRADRLAAKLQTLGIDPGEES
jgi:non-ribosomal peptide synthetase component E (peptide arylation enzyme)